MASGVLWGSQQDGWYESVNHLSRATPWLHEPLRIYADYGVVLFGAFLLLSWWLARRSGDLRAVMAALWAPVGVLLAVGLNQPLGAAVGEPRPYAVLPHPLLLVARSSDFSFPSDHAVMAGAAAAGVLLAHRRLGAVVAVAALLMAATRVYVGAHFPLDVIVGLLFGAAVALLSYAAVRPLAERLLRVLAGTRMRPLLVAEHVGGQARSVRLTWRASRS